MSDERTYPTHRISFAEKITDRSGNPKVGKPVEVAVVWPRKDGKQGGVLEWNIKPEKLGDGVWFHLENDRQQTRANESRQTSAQAAQDRFDRVDRGQKQARGLER